MINDLKKEAFFRELWEKAVDFFGGEKRRAQRRVDYHFSDKTGPEKWQHFPRNSTSSEFVKKIKDDPRADDKLKMHAQSLYDLSKGPTVTKVESSKGSGKKYEVKRMPGGGMGCTCNDWRYKGSVTPGYECKHIKAAKVGLTKAAAFNAQVNGFFDEMRAIQRAKEIATEKERRNHLERPWQNTLLEDEEPTDYRPQNPAEWSEPETLLRGQGI